MVSTIRKRAFPAIVFRVGLCSLFEWNGFDHGRMMPLRTLNLSVASPVAEFPVRLPSICSSQISVPMSKSGSAQVRRRL